MQEGPSKIVKQEFIVMLSEAIEREYPGHVVDESQIVLSISPADIDLADLSSSIAFKLAKLAHSNPVEIAKTLASKMGAGEHIKSVVDLNGYINAEIDQNKYAALVIGSVDNDKDDYGRSGVGSEEQVMVEFPSANPNKPWLVSHLRNALLGDTISNIMEFCSYKVEREDYIDDLGLQMAESLWGWLKLSNKPEGKVDQWFGEKYVEVNKELEKQEVKDEVNELLGKIEDLKSNESKTVREEIAEKSVLAQSETAFSYGIFHDVMIWESDIVRAQLLSQAMEMAKGIMEKPTEGKYAGATVVKLEDITKFAKELEGSREDAKVIIRSNGAATYLAKDFAFHSWKFGLINADFKFKKLIEKQPNGKPIFSTAESGEKMEFGGMKKAINIIDIRQSYEQTILRIMFSLTGHEEIAKNIIHLAYAIVKIEGGTLSARKTEWLGEEGRSYTADELLKEAKDRAKEITSKSEKITDKSDIDKIAEAVALSAIKFEYLKIAPEREILFSWEKALNFEGNSGPYCLYTYARAARIIEKAGSFTPTSEFTHMERAQDFELIKRIGMFQEIVEKACNEYRTNVITDYLLDLASEFSKFYEEMPVLKGGDAMQERLSIVSAVRQVTKNALALLGISVVEKM
jgi:arginyl-tRNA synthetase